MNKILELKRIKKDSIARNSNVTFDVAAPYSEGIAYDITTGEITLPEKGQYAVRWWVTTQATLKGCIQFAIKSTQGDIVLGCSPTKQGQIVGFADIYAKTDNVKLSLVNAGDYNVYLSKSPPETAAILVTHIPDPSSQRAYGQIDTATDTVAIAANVPAAVPMPGIGDCGNVDTTIANSIKIKVTGYYHLIYSFYPLFTASTPITLSFAVRSNKVNIDQTVSTTPAPADTFNASYIGSTIAHLAAGDVVDVAVGSTADISMSFDSSTISSLILYKVD